MKTPDILLGAIRVYSDNADLGLVIVLDLKETAKIVTLLQKVIGAQSRLLVSYRTGGKPPAWVFDVLDKARKAGVMF